MKVHQRQTGTFELSSNLLGREVSYYAIFPADIQTKEIPVLYLLHGLFGRFDNWVNNTEILDYAEDLPLAIICVEGGDNWYADSPLLENHLYESYILEELIPAVERQFFIGGERSRRAIAGLSMGGYGAFKFVFRRPEMFCFVAAMSGAFHAAKIYADDVWAELSPSIMNIFGHQTDLRSNNDLFQLVKNFPSNKIAELPQIYFNCGAEDSFLPVNISLHKLFQQRGILSEFEMLSGGHDWDYWNRTLKVVLDKTKLCFQKNRS